jgi:DNA (cytosine-5)-methyltransferase 1
LIKNKKKIVQYSDPRVLTIYELMIVTTLPTNWPIPDWADDGFIRKVIGEGIPSLLVRKIFNQLLDQII